MQTAAGWSDNQLFNSDPYSYAVKNPYLVAPKPFVPAACGNFPSAGRSGPPHLRSAITSPLETRSDGGTSTGALKGTNVYVSNMPSSMTNGRFRTLFSSFGAIIGVRLVKRRKGDAPVGFVQFTTAGMAQAAILAMDGRTVEGSKLSVRLANRDKDKGIDNKPSSNLYVSNLPQRVTEVDLRAVFSRFGEIHSLRVLKNTYTGVSKGTALVRFVSLEDAVKAKDSLHCQSIYSQDMPLEVKYAESKEEKLSRRDDRGRDRTSATSSPSLGLGPPSSAGVTTPPSGLFDHITFDLDDADIWSVGEELLPCDLMADEPATTPITSPKLSAAENQSAMHALSFYIQSMSGTVPPAQINSTRNSPSSSVVSSLGHLSDSLGTPEGARSKFGTPTGQGTPRPDAFQLSAEATPFIPAVPFGELALAPEASDSVTLKGLPAGTDKLRLYEVFGPLGAIVKIDIRADAPGTTTCTAVVSFRSTAEASEARRYLCCAGQALGGPAY